MGTNAAVTFPAAKARRLVLDYIRENGFASFPELQGLFEKHGIPYKGDKSIAYPTNPHIVYWAGWSREAADFVCGMAAAGTVTAIRATLLHILLSGGGLRLPQAVRKHYTYKTPHWLPIVFLSGTQSSRQSGRQTGRRQGRQGQAREGELQCLV